MMLKLTHTVREVYGSHWRFGDLAGRKNLPASKGAPVKTPSLNLGVGVVTGGDGANFGERLISQQHAIFKDRFKRVRTEGGAFGQ